MPLSLHGWPCVGRVAELGSLGRLRHHERRTNIFAVGRRVVRFPGRGALSHAVAERVAQRYNRDQRSASGDLGCLAAPDLFRCKKRVGGPRGFACDGSYCLERPSDYGGSVRSPTSLQP